MDAGPDASAETSAEDASTDAPATQCVPQACTLDQRTLVVPFADHPALANVGGSAVVRDSRYKDPNCGLGHVIVAQTAQGVFVAFSASCSHSCCQIKLSGNGFVCPCHGSRFNSSGKVTQGPATGALQPLSTCADDCGVYVELP